MDNQQTKTNRKGIRPPRNTAAKIYARASTWDKLRKRQLILIAADDPELAQKISDHLGWDLDFSDLPRKQKPDVEEVLRRHDLRNQVIVQDSYTEDKL